MKTRLTALALLAALALTACTNSETPTVTRTADTATAVSDPEPALTPDDMTQLVVDLSWAQQSEDDRDAMCLGITLYGTNWAADQMHAGAGDNSVDWERAAQLVEQKCAAR